MAEYHYVEEDDFGYYKIKCEMCNREVDITEEQMQHCNDAGSGDICYGCMWGKD